MPDHLNNSYIIILDLAHCSLQLKTHGYTNTSSCSHRYCCKLEINTSISFSSNTAYKCSTLICSMFRSRDVHKMLTHKTETRPRCSIFTALHCMQGSLSDERLSVRLSVKRVNCDKTKAPSENSSIMSNRKSPTSFPMSLR